MPVIAAIVMAIIFWHPLLWGGQIPWHGDLSWQYYPWFVELRQHLRSEQLPLWIPHMGAGYPLWAEGEAGVFYPLNWLLALLPLNLGFNLIFPLHSIIAFWGMYLLAQRLRLSSWARMLSAIVFTYSFFLTTRTIHPPIIAATSFLPWGILAIEQLATRRPAWWFSLIVALQWLAGHPQMAFVSLLIYGVYLALRSLSWKNLGLFLLYVFLGLGLAMVQILPTIELALNSTRAAQDLSQIFMYSLPKSHLLTYLFPYFFGIAFYDQLTGFWQFNGSYWEFALYVGIAPLVLITISCLSRQRLAIRWLIIWLIFTLLALGGYLAPYRFLVRLTHLPFRESSRFLAGATLAAALLTGLGFDHIRKLKSFRPLIYLFICLTLVLVAATRPWPLALLKRLVFTEFQPVTWWHFSLANIAIWPSYVLLIITLAAIWVYRRRWLSSVSFPIFITGLIVVDLVLQGYLYQRFVPQTTALQQPESVRQIKTASCRRLASWIDWSHSWQQVNYLLQPNLNLLWDIPAIKDTSPLSLQHHLDKPLTGQNDWTLLPGMGVDCVLAPTQPPPPGWTTIATSKWGSLYQSSASRPRFFITDNQGSAELVSETETSQNLTVTLPQNGQLVVLDSYYPGWKAWVDGKPTQIKRVDDIFRGIDVPAGEHQVVFKYVPISFYIGFIISLAALIVIIVLAV